MCLSHVLSHQNVSDVSALGTFPRWVAVAFWRLVFAGKLLYVSGNFYDEVKKELGVLELTRYQADLFDSYQVNQQRHLALAVSVQ